MGEPFAQHAAQHILASLASRLRYLANKRWLGLLTLAGALPQASADDVFQPHATNDSAVADDTSAIMSFFNYYLWRANANAIRDQPSTEFCYGNLSLFLSTVGPAVQADLNGSSGALSLLPTAGALVGAPAQELWVLFKLMPLAGVLSMLLSLGGNVIPTDPRDYNANASTFSYGGFIATTKPAAGEDDADEPPVAIQGMEPKLFAARVRQKAMKEATNRKPVRIGIGIGLQLLWIAVLIITCCLVQSGSIIVWWCQMQGWMLLWYLTVAASSLLANFAGVPFSEQWTIRVSRAPALRINGDAPLVIDRDPNLSKADAPAESSQNLESETINPSTSLQDSKAVRNDLIHVKGAMNYENGLTSPRRPTSAVLQSFQNGYKLVDKAVYERREPQDVPSRYPFYVIISVQGLTKRHALLRIFTKSLSICVFGAGTGIFASASLIYISIAAAALCLVLGAGMFGRVIAMWMANEMIRDEPILHQVVRNHRQAEEYVRNILAQPGVLFEINGHAVVDGRCVERYNPWLRLSTYFGVLAPPFRLSPAKRHSNAKSMPFGGALSKVLAERV